MLDRFRLVSTTLATLALLGATACGSSSDDDNSGGGGEGGAAGSGGAAGGGGSAGAAGGGVEPIEGPNEQWAWIDFPDSKCANGSPTGIGVNFTDRTDKVALHFMGGGACWDSLTCDTLTTAVFLDGFPGAAFEQQSGGLSAGMFDRDSTTNPFADYSYVFIPYCTGDVHSGSNPMGPTGKSFVGFDNFGLYLERLKATFPDASQIVVTGSSAGGFGTLTNFKRIADAFPKSEVLLLDDSGPAMAPEYLSPALQQLTMGDAWSMEKNLPPECPDVGIGTVHNIHKCLSEQYPNSRMAVVATLRDSTILSFFTFGNTGLTGEKFEEGNYDLADSVLKDLPNWHIYLFPGSAHTVLLTGDINRDPVDGVLLTDWIDAFLAGDSSWEDVRPDAAE